MLTQIDSICDSEDCNCVTAYAPIYKNLFVI